MDNSLIFILLSPLLFLVSGIFFLAPNRKAVQFDGFLPSWLSILGFFLGVVAFWQTQITDSRVLRLFEYQGLGVSFRFDSLSTLIFLMISVLAYFVIRFSRNYLDGEPKKTQFFGKLMLTIAFVEILVLSNNMLIFILSWVAMSISLQRLILFYPNRFHAQLASLKKFIAARVSDLFLILAFILLFNEFNSGDFEVIFNALHQDDFVLSQTLEWSIMALVFSAAAKSAQFPLHTWLIEVMETPTPVSALLHAGLLNAGPFLMLRFANFLEISQFASAILIVIGLISAIFGTIVYTLQPSIKTALSYSSVAHMGFTLLLCGFGIYAAALLHLVSHSFYKAHAFLSTGSVVDRVKSLQFVRLANSNNPIHVLLALVLSLSLFSGFAWLFDINLKEEVAFLVVGGVFMIGITTYVANAISSTQIWETLSLVGWRMAFICVSFFSFEHLLADMTEGVLPDPVQPGKLISVLLGITLFLLALIGFSLMSPQISQNRNLFWNKYAVHFRNGLYINQIFDRFLAEHAAKRLRKFKTKTKL
jgi:NAD(P)H-quinone oxidoreductase subunit 5